MDTSQNASQWGWIGKMIDKIWKFLFGQNVAAGIVGIVCYILGGVLIVFGVIAFVKGIKGWLGKESKEEWSKQILGGIAAVAIGFSLGGLITWIMTFINS